MAWSKTLRAWALGETDEQGVDAVVPDLVALVADLHRGADQLEVHAAQAPNESAERDLRQLSNELQMAADRLSAELGRRGMAVPPVTDTQAAANGESHWTRLVQDLEHLQAARNRLLALWSALNQNPSELTAVLEELSRVVHSQLARMRMLIARADPQALD